VSYRTFHRDNITEKTPELPLRKKGDISLGAVNFVYYIRG
jgi:hypothetical protein